MKHRARVLTTLILFSTLRGVRAGEEKPTAVAPAILIETEQLEKELGSRHLRVLDARSRPEYEKGHVPGAVRVDVRKWSGLAASEGGFQNAAAWGEAVGELGIDRKTRVVVYGDRLTDVARVWWTLAYLGLEEVRVLDAGWSAWLREKRPVETTSQRPQKVSFEPRFQKDRLAECGQVKEALDDRNTIILDVRSDGEFNGTVVRGARGGHIPGAVHLEWTRLVNEDGRFKAPKEIAGILEKHGIARGKALVPY